MVQTKARCAHIYIKSKIFDTCLFVICNLYLSQYNVSYQWYINLYIFQCISKQMTVNPHYCYCLDFWVNSYYEPIGYNCFHWLRFIYQNCTRFDKKRLSIDKKNHKILNYLEIMEWNIFIVIIPITDKSRKKFMHQY